MGVRCMHALAMLQTRCFRPTDFSPRSRSFIGKCRGGFLNKKETLDVVYYMFYLIKPIYKLLFKRICLDFFSGLEKFPRFATMFFQKVTYNIEPELLGKSTVNWWMSM